MSVVISVLKSVGGKLLVALITDKVALKLGVLFLEKAIASPRTGKSVDDALRIVKEEIEKLA